jgi:putative ABC transport system ATP-binding protein
VVDFNGQDLAALRERQVNRARAGSIGFIFQTFNLIPTLTAQENVETALVPLGVGASERRSSAARALADVGLSDRARPLPLELSDEPTGNLDESTRDEIISLLDGMWRSRGLTLVLVTHDSTIAGRAQRIGLMRNGQLDIKQDTRHGAS